MYSIKHNCTCGKCKCTTDSIFATVKENGRKLTINNIDGSKICIIKLDGCVYEKGRGPSRCDYFFSFISADGNQKRVLFVELKGGHIDDAFEQIESTLKILGKDIKNSDKQALIIGKKCPRLDSSKTKKKKDYFKEKLNIKLLVRTGEFEFDHNF